MSRFVKLNWVFYFERMEVLTFAYETVIYFDGIAIFVRRVLYEGVVRDNGSHYYQKYGFEIRSLSRFLQVRLRTVDKIESSAGRSVYVGHV